MKCRMLALLAVLILVPSAYATTCFDDRDCGAGYICDETNRTATGLTQCSLPTLTSCGETISCATDANCAGIGTEQCGYSDVCVMSVTIGGVCQQDDDCGAGRNCILGSCSGVFPQSCSSDSDCSSNSCIDWNTSDTSTQGLCVSKRQLGMACDTNSDCDSGRCDSVYDFCTGCDSTWGIDGSGNIPANRYCDIHRYEYCSLTNVYQKESQTQDRPVPVITEKKALGDACQESGCCASNACVNYTCVGATLPTYSDFTNNYCSDYGYDLTTTWFDGFTGASNLNAHPNTTVFEAVFGKTNLTLFRNWRAHDGHNHSDDGWSYWYRDTSRVGTYAMVALFYEVDNNEFCYFKQVGYDILWACADSPISRNETQSNSTHSIFLDAFSATSDDDDFVIVSTGSQLYGGNDYFGIVGLIFYQEGFIVRHDILSTGDDQNGAVAYDARFRYRTSGDGSYISVRAYTCNGESGLSHSLHGFGVDRNDLRNNAGGDDGYCTAFGFGISEAGIVTTTSSTYTEYGYDWRLAASSNPPATGWITYTPISETVYVDAECCDENSDCPIDYCCNTDYHTCYWCGGQPVTKLGLQIEGGRVRIPPSTTDRIIAKLTEFDDTPIANKLITFNTTGGSITTTCITDYQGECAATFTAPAAAQNVTIGAIFAGDLDYSPAYATTRLWVTVNSHLIVIETVDAADPSTKVGGVRVYHASFTPPYKFTDLITGLTMWDNLPAAPLTYLVYVSRSGYESGYANVTLDSINQIYMMRTNESEEGTEEEAIPNLELTSPIPTDVGEVTSGFNEIMRILFGRYFLVIFFIILFLIALGIVRGVIGYVTQ